MYGVPRASIGFYWGYRENRKENGNYCLGLRDHNYKYKYLQLWQRYMGVVGYREFRDYYVTLSVESYTHIKRMTILTMSHINTLTEHVTVGEL